MRALFFLLVLVNLLFYGWHAGYLGPGMDKQGEPERFAQQIAPEKIRVVTSDPAARPGDSARTRNTCLEWGSFPPQEAERAQAVLVGLGLGDRLTSRKADETAQWWVYMPPQGSKANADKKTEELTRLGITDYFVVTDDGPGKYAISLGVFRTEDAAKNYLASLVAKGVKTLGAPARRETKVQKTLFQIRDVDDAMRAKLADIRKDFAGIDLHDCPADAKKADDAKKG